MSTAIGKGWLRPWLILISSVFFIYGVNVMLFPRDVWIQDEARYGEVVREMAVNQTYMVPFLDGEFYPDKPPLYFWLLVLQAKMSGMNAFSFRLVTLFSMLAFAAAFYVFCRRLMGEGRAIWAGLLLQTSMLFLVAGNIVRMDLLLAFFVILSLHFFMRAIDESDSTKSLWGYGFAILGVMVKGPLGLAFPLLAATAYALVQGGRKGLQRLRLAHGLGLTILVAGLWTGYLAISGRKDYVEDVFITQIWGRSVKSWSHPEPFYFYALVLLPLLMPWLPFVWRGFRKTPPHILRVVLCWFLPGLVLISAVSGKLFIYLVPIFPAFALLVASALPAPWENDTWDFGVWPGLISGSFFLVLGGGLFFALLTQLPQERLRLLAVAAVPLLLGAYVLFLGFQRKGRRLVVTLLLGSCLVSWVCFGWGASQINDYLSTRKPGIAMAEAGRAGYEPAAVDMARGTMSFYAGTIIRNLSHGELMEALKEPGRLVVGIRNKRKDRVPKEAMERLRVFASFPKIRFHGYTLYVERENEK